MSSYDHLAEHLADEAKGNHGKSLSKVGAQKFTKSTKAYAKLKKMFEDKLILPTDGAKDVRARDPLFHDFTHNQFRSQFNNLRKEMGTVTREGKHCMFYSHLHSLNSILTDNVIDYRLPQRRQEC